MTVTPHFSRYQNTLYWLAEDRLTNGRLLLAEGSTEASAQQGLNLLKAQEDVDAFRYESGRHTLPVPG